MFKVSVRYDIPPNTMKRSLNNAIKFTLQETVLWWHGQLFPGHFDPGAQNRYKYTSRSGKYKKEKRRKKGHADPLTFSGRMKRDLMRYARASGTAKKARVVMTGPQHINFQKSRKRSNKKIDKVRELTAVTNDELLDLADIAEGKIPRLFEQTKQPKKKRL